MSQTPTGGVLHQLTRLFDSGTSSGMTEAQLLARFVETREESAFAALVERFGPMVLGVCRKLLPDNHAAEDAFQATFLVLLRRAGSIRDGDLLGNWLYGVTLKVAKRSRADLARRNSREKGSAGVEAETASESANPEIDLGPILHEELARLPENYRKPLVLCFLDGRSHEEAARQLRWPLGTIKGRIARGKDLLRQRLGRRGVTISTATIAAILAETASATVPTILINSTVKAAMGIAAGGAVAAGAYSTTAAALSEGVVTSMTLTKFKLAAALIVALGTVATSAGVMARQQQHKTGDMKEAVVKKVQSGADLPTTEDTKISTEEYIAVKAGGFSPSTEASLLKSEPPIGNLPPMSELAAKRLAAAEKAMDANAAFYENGTITIDRLLASAKNLLQARVEVAASEKDRIQATESYVRALRAMVKREEAKYQVGSGAMPNLREVQSELSQAEFNLAKARSGQVVAAKVQPGENPDEEDDPVKNKSIRELLMKPISMPFASETPLEEILKYIRNATTTESFPTGIPIYVDPVALQESEKTMASPVSLNLDAVPLRTSLRLLLKQLDLSYFIKDGLLIIACPKSDDFPESAMTAIEKAQRTERKAEEKRMKEQPASSGGGGGFR